MTKRRMAGLRYVRDEWVGPDELGGADQVKALLLETYWRRGEIPPAKLIGKMDPRLAAAVLERLGIYALGVQGRMMDLAIKEGASEGERQLGAMVARNVLDRALGKPVERVAVAGKVEVTFAGLDPTRLPAAEAVDRTEVVEVEAEEPEAE